MTLSNKLVPSKSAIAACLVPLIICTSAFSTLASEGSSEGEGLPGRRVGGGTRGDYALVDSSKSTVALTAIVPANNLGLTLSAYPTFFLYLPPTSHPKLMEFVLQDDLGRPVYETTFVAPGKAGVMGVQLPKSAALKPLAVGKNYHWYFSIISDPEKRDKDISVDGWVQRIAVNPQLAQQLVQASPLERARIYASSNLWHEALVTLAELQYSHPNTPLVAQQWSNLMRSVGLDTIAHQPISLYEPSSLTSMAP